MWVPPALPHLLTLLALPFSSPSICRAVWQTACSVGGALGAVLPLTLCTHEGGVS